MWKVKLDDGVWLTKEGTTTEESEALLLPDMPSAQNAIKVALQNFPWPMPIVVFDTEDTQPE